MAAPQTYGELLPRTYEELSRRYLDDNTDAPYRGYLYEAMWRLVLVHEGIEEFTTVVDPKTRVPLTTTGLLPRSIVGGADEGVDFYLFNPTDSMHLMLSCKYFTRDDSHALGDYGLDTLIARGRDLAPVRWGLLVNNSQSVTGLVQRSHHPDKAAIKYVLGREMLARNYDRVCAEIRTQTKPSLKLRLHQEYLKRGVLRCFEHNDTALIAAKPRSGKTIIMGAIIEKFTNSLLVTSVPSETMSQYKEDLLRKYANFTNYTVVELADHVQDGTYNGPRDRVVILASKQFLDHHYGLAGLPALDLLLYDEVDYSGTTLKSRDWITRLRPRKLLLITATYVKVIARFNLQPHQVFRWMMEDSHRLATYPETAFEITPELSELIAERGGLGLEVYREEPRLQVLTPQLTPALRERLDPVASPDGYGFSFRTLFSLDGTGNFVYLREVEALVAYIFGGARQQWGFDNEHRPIWERVAGSSRNFLLFLPSDNIEAVSQALERVLAQHPVVASQCVIRRINGKTKREWANIREELETLETQTGKHVLVLVGKMLRRAISLPRFDVALLLMDDHSVDQYTQIIYRVLTERPGKRFGYVFDMLPGRTLHACFRLNSYDSSSEGHRRWLFKLIDFDPDLPFASETERGQHYDELLRELDEYGRRYALNVTFENELDVLIDTDPRCQVLRDILSRYQTRRLDLPDFVAALDKTTGEIKTGAVRKPSPRGGSVESKYYKNLSYLFKWAVLLLRDVYTGADVRELFRRLQEDPIRAAKYGLVVAPEAHTLDVNQLIEAILVLIEARELSANVKVQKLLTRFREDLAYDVIPEREYIELFRRLVGDPTQREVDERSEVYTPVELVQEMLDALPEDVWSNPQLTWIEPGCGLAPFLYCVFNRLMKGLTGIPEHERAEYILANMLYLNDISPRNLLVAREIFGNRIPESHIYQGDFLTMNLPGPPENVVIVGNPPYNTPKGQGVKPIYNLFIEHALPRCRILCLVIPGKWLYGAGKGLGKFTRMMFQRTDLTLLKILPEPVFPEISLEGGVCYFVRDTRYEGRCRLVTSSQTLEIDLRNCSDLTGLENQALLTKLAPHPRLTSLYRPRNFYGIETNDQRLTEAPVNPTDVKVYVSQNKGDIKYISANVLPRTSPYYKVLTPRANGNRPCFGRVLLGTPGEVHSGTYISFDVHTYEQSVGLKSYLETRTANYLLSLKKKTQDISEKTLAYIPLVPLTYDNGQPVMWTDEALFAYFGLTPEEQACIRAYEGRPRDPEPGVAPVITERDKIAASKGRSGYTREQLVELAKSRHLTISGKLIKSQLVDKLLA